MGLFGALYLNKASLQKQKSKLPVTARQDCYLTWQLNCIIKQWPTKIFSNFLCYVSDT